MTNTVFELHLVNGIRTAVVAENIVRITEASDGERASKRVGAWLNVATGEAQQLFEFGVTESYDALIDAYERAGYRRFSNLEVGER